MRAASARATASALSVAADQEPHLVGAVEGARRSGVTRSGGGLGESVTRDGDRSSTSSCGKPGNSEATWPSGPTPSITTSNAPAPCSRSAVGVRRRGRRRRRRPSAVDGISWTLAGSTPTGRGTPRAPGAALRSSESAAHEALVAPPEDHPRPVDLGRRAPAGRARGGSSSAMVPPVSADLRHLAARPGRPSSRASSSPATAVARSARVVVDLDRGAASATARSCGRFFSEQLRAVRGVDVVLVEAAQLLGEQLGQRRGASARPAGRAGRGRRTSPACRRRGEIRIGPSLVVQHDLGDAGARRSSSRLDRAP